MTEPLRAVVLGATSEERALPAGILEQLGCDVVHTELAYEAFRRCCDGPADVLFVVVGDDPSEALDLATTLRANALTSRT